MTLPAAPLIRTVLGDIRPDELGFCDAHEHLFLRTPQLPGEELDDLDAARVDLRHYRRLGGRAVVQWTPYGLSRRLPDLVELGRYAGVHLVAATGLHQARHYDPEQLARVLPRLTRLFVDELTAGTGTDGPYGEPVRAGMIKAAGSYHGLDQHARTVLFAAAEAHHETGAPIGVHLEGGTAGLDVVALLCEAREVPPASVILAHLNRWPDPRTHADLAATGVFLQFDGPSPGGHATDWRLLDCLSALAGAGYAGQLLLGGNATSAVARGSNGEGPGMEYLLRTLVPALERHVGAPFAEQIFERNPARAFSWRAA
jgi:predicted metal-dependent phosphotriesterase family hydrolase